MRRNNLSFIETQMVNDWYEILSPEFSKDYFVKLDRFLFDENQQGKCILPGRNNLFRALDSTPFSEVKVVIIGQDPYHGAGQANGLSFSVNPDIKIPPSLKNIFVEISRSLGINNVKHGCLDHWAEQGVLLLNSVLTVEEGKAASHAQRGWEVFTDNIIEKLNFLKQDIIYLLWGKYAQKKGGIINKERNYVLESSHPSPLSVRRGFLGNNHFAKVNNYLRNLGMKEIDWRV